MTQKAERNNVREILSHLRESGSISWRLLDDPGGITCIVIYSPWITQKAERTSGRFCLTWGSAGVGLHFLEAPGWSGRYHVWWFTVLGLHRRLKETMSGRFCLTWGSAGVGLYFLEAPWWSGRYHMYGDLQFLDYTEGWKNVREILSHLRECESRVPFPGGSRMIREVSHVWWFTVHGLHRRLKEHPGRICFTWGSAGVGLHFLEAPEWSRMYHMYGDLQSMDYTEGWKNIIGLQFVVIWVLRNWKTTLGRGSTNHILKNLAGYGYGKQRMLTLFRV